MQEKRIAELEGMVKDLFPEGKGKMANIDVSRLIESADFSLSCEKSAPYFPQEGQ